MLFILNRYNAHINCTWNIQKHVEKKNNRFTKRDMVFVVIKFKFKIYTYFICFRLFPREWSLVKIFWFFISSQAISGHIHVDVFYCIFSCLLFHLRIYLISASFFWYVWWKFRHLVAFIQVLFMFRQLFVITMKNWCCVSSALTRSSLG